MSMLSSNMKVAFYGSSNFSQKILAKLLDFHKNGKIQLEYVVSQPSKAAGRNKEVKDNPVVVFCKSHSIRLLTPTKLKETVEADVILNSPVDLSIVAAYGKILRPEILNTAKYGFINFHGSLLPALRGATPVQTSILEQNPDVVGVTVIKMDEGMDTGAVVSSEQLTVSSEKFEKLTSGELMEKLADLSAEMLERDFDYLFSPENWKLEKQDESKATYCYVSDFEKAKLEIGYSDSIKLAHGKVMSANPEPKAWMSYMLKSAKVKINVICSRIVKEELLIQSKCDLAFHNFQKKLYLELSEGFLEILEIQPEGKKIMTGSEFANGFLR